MATILPGRALGFLVLGSSLHLILSTLLQSPKLYSPLEISCDDENIFDSWILLDLHGMGLRLYFEPYEQRLRLIECYKWGCFTMKYRASEIGKNSAPSFRSLYSKVFGPTYAGVYLKTKNAYMLSYPGVSFEFPLKSDKNNSYDEYISLLSHKDAKPCSGMLIFKGNNWTEAQLNLMKRNKLNFLFDTDNTTFSNKRATYFYHNNNSISEIDYVTILNNRKIELNIMHSNSKENQIVEIILNQTSMQDVIMKLGSPSDIYTKRDSCISIHGLREGTFENEPSETALGEIQGIFYNYYSLGLDILFDIHTFKVTKVLLHGNLPGTFLFHRYQRCRWIIPEYKVDSETDFQSILNEMDESKFTGPMLLNKGLDSPSSSVEFLDKEELEETISFGWGNSELYGFPGYIFEVSAGKYVSSLTIY